MPLPLWIIDAIEEKISQHSINRLALAYDALKKVYKEGEATGNASSQEEFFWEAYMAARLPATYGSVQKTIEQIPESILSSIQNVLDLGTGPGTAVFAMAEILSSQACFTCIDKESVSQEIFEYLWKRSPYHDRFPFSWLPCDISKGLSHIHQKYDAVVCSYTLGEISNLPSIVEEIWAKTNLVFLLIEPGTMQGFSTIRKAREILCQKGAFLAAPCPHENPCPMEHSNWCHFSARIPRTSLMRKIKGGQLGYEDEKFSYSIFIRQKILSPAPRILRHPQFHGGHVSLQLCTPDGIDECIISKKNPLYKKARKSSWGLTL